MDFIQEIRDIQKHFPSGTGHPMYMALELCTESAEAGEKMKKLVRKYSIESIALDSLTPEEHHGLVMEMADALYCLMRFADWAGVNREQLETMVITKIKDRISRGVHLGSGDKR